MKKRNKEDLIYKSLDGSLSEDEIKELMFWLQDSSENRKLYKEITGLRQQVSETAITSFKPLFEDRVIDRLNQAGTSESASPGLGNSLIMSFRRVAFAAALILALLITYNLQSGNDYSITRLFGEQQSNLEYAFDPVHNIFGSGQ